MIHELRKDLRNDLVRKGDIESLKQALKDSEEENEELSSKVEELTSIIQESGCLMDTLKSCLPDLKKQHNKMLAKFDSLDSDTVLSDPYLTEISGSLSETGDMIQVIEDNFDELRGSYFDENDEENVW